MSMKIGLLILILIGLLLVAPVAMVAQGCVSSQSIEPAVPTGTGQPAPNASIRVCTATATGTPCSPTATIYVDPALSTPLANPFTSDVNGVWSFCAASGNYLTQISPVVGQPAVYSVYATASNSSATVTSVALALPTSMFAVSGSPVSSTGTLTGTFISQSAGLVFGNCGSGPAVPSFCSISASMIPSTLGSLTINGTLTTTSTGNTLIGGTLGVLSSTTLTGTLISNGASNLNGGGSFVGTFSANAIFSGNPAFTGTPTFAGFQLPALSQTVIGLQGSTGTKLATASGSFTNTHLLCANATADIVDCGSSSGFVQLAGDLGNSAATPFVVSTHLSSSLPTSQGGTGINNLTFSGSTHEVATVSGALVNGDTVVIDGSGNLVDSNQVKMLVQAGSNFSCTSSCTWTYPTAYVSAIPTCFCTGQNGSCNVQVGSTSKTSCSFNASASGGVNYMVVGTP
jgi:hypothetical protein